MILLSLENVQKSFGLNVVLRSVDLTLQTGQKLGLVGVNGCGKSTLLKVITGELDCDGGVVSLRRGTTMGILTQTADIRGDLTIRQELERVFDGVRAMEQRLRDMEARMAEADGEELEQLSHDYSRLMDRFEDAGGYEWPSRITGVLAGLGFAKGRENARAGELSGGEKTRLCLARLLLEEPELLLLDEPTNHLDLESVAWLEDTLKKYRGSVIVISHDRYFLNNVCDSMAELMNGTITQYEGNYDAYQIKRRRRLEALTKEYTLQQKEIARQLAIIERYRMYNREKSIRAAESREKRLEKMELVEKPVSEEKVRFSFTARRKTGEDVLIARGLEKRFGERVLFSDLSLHITSGDRIALIGPNGIGKTTLLRMLAGRAGEYRGTVAYGSNVDIGYYDQHQAELHDGKTVLNELWDDFPKLDQDRVRGVLALFLFTGEDVFQTVGTLSGGEKGRVALAKLMLRGDNFLLLDEPTNHLDMDSREVLEGALQDFDGTIFTVSHDRYFINRTANKVLELSENGLTLYLGNYDDYLEKKRQQAEDDAGDTSPGLTRTQQDKLRRKKLEARRGGEARRKRLRELEDEISRREEELSALEDKQGDSEYYTDGEKMKQLLASIDAQKALIDSLYEEWTELSEMEE